MYVIFDNAEGTDRAMICFHKNQDEQREMMHRLDIDKQVKDWQKTNSGNPPKFYSRITIKRFTNENLSFSNLPKN
jgi:hypothetical protein